MKEDRSEMDRALKEVVLPALRAAGFKGSLPHLRRLTATGVDLITFQFDKNGGGFVIEIARGSVEGHTTHWGLHIPREKLRVWDLHPSERHRLQPGPGGGTDAWFRFDREPCGQVAHKALNALSQAEAWWHAGAQQNAPEDALKQRASER